MRFKSSIVFVTLAACSGYSAVDSLPTPAIQKAQALPALANAGADREILRGLTSSLDGTATFAPSGSTLTYQWEQVAGTQVFLSNPAELLPSFVAPLDEGALTFVLTVDDGRYVTTDEVTVWVKNSPTLLAPRVRAGADRIEEYGGSMQPKAQDVVQVAPNDATVRWEALSFATSRLSIGAADLSQAAVFRVDAESAGLRSAPDYLVLWPYDMHAYGQVAPTCTLEAPLVVAPNTEFTLNASACADANADGLQRRWVQSRGDRVVAEPRDASRLTLVAPNRVQELGFRVYARDKALESAAAEVVVLVATSETLVPTVSPVKELLAHPNNVIRVDATSNTSQANFDEDAPQAPQDVVYAWTQTAGSPVATRDTLVERVLTFAAPNLAIDQPTTQLAFAVVAHASDIVSDAAVVRITVVSPEQNQEPTISFCTSATSWVPGEVVTITARVQDPEQDDIISLTWSNESQLEYAAAAEPALGCDTGNASINDAAREWQSISFTVPNEGTAQAFELTACDALGACNKANY